MEYRKVERKLNRAMKNVENEYDAKFEEFEKLEKNYSSLNKQFSLAKSANSPEAYHKAKEEFKKKTAAFMKKKKEWDLYTKKSDGRWMGIFNRTLEIEELHNAEIEAIKARFSNLPAGPHFGVQ